jgi:phosphoglycolate phosphatase-like HAD superfamily hydrolase
MSIQAIIFDVDGTLADTEDGHRIAFNRAFAERGCPGSGTCRCTTSCWP